MANINQKLIAAIQEKCFKFSFFYLKKYSHTTIDTSVYPTPAMKDIYHPYGVVALAITKEGYFFISHSVCNPIDTFNKKVGVEIALHRLYDQLDIYEKRNDSNRQLRFDLKEFSFHSARRSGSIVNSTWQNLLEYFHDHYSPNSISSTLRHCYSESSNVIFQKEIKWLINEYESSLQ